MVAGVVKWELPSRRELGFFFFFVFYKIPLAALRVSAQRKGTSGALAARSGMMAAEVCGGERQPEIKANPTCLAWAAG